MSCSKLDYRYSARIPFRGLFVIINNEIFKELPRRNGSEKDVEKLQNTFKQLGFQFEIYKDRNCIEMLQAMDKVSRRSDLDEFDCIAVAILTHGTEGNQIHGVDKNDLSSLDTILQPLKRISRGIPKLIFVQACRGNELDEGHYVHADDSGSKTDDNYIRVPIESDFLYHFSTSPGYYSFRNVNGSIFIQRLCDVFDEYIKEEVEIDLLKSLIQVNRRVAEDYESNVPKDRAFHDKKQMPSIMCMLRKDVYLKKQA